MLPKILLLDTISDKGIEAIKQFSDLVDGRSFSYKQIAERIHLFDGLIIKSNNHIDKELLDKACNLKIIGRAGSGTDNIDMQEASIKKIKIITSPEGNASSVAEYVLCMIILLSHKLAESHEGASVNDFRRHVWQGRNMEKMTVGIIGLGTIGKQVLKKLSPLCTKVIGYDPYVQDSIEHTDNFFLTTDLTYLHKNSDAITLHIPLTNETKHLLNKETFSLVKKGCILINSSRGQVINDNDFLWALENGIIESAAIDTLYPDPEFNKSPKQSTFSHFLIHHPQIYYTPHIAAGTKDALDDVAINLADKMKLFFSKKYMSNEN